jgi:uncharacterized protein YaaR (DUF327 family)
MESNKELIDIIKEIRSSVNIRTMNFLKLLLEMSPKKGKQLLDKIQLGDQKVQKLSDLLHMKKERTDLEILNEIEEIRALNNTLWMDVVRMCFELDANRARSIFSKVKECDRKIQQLSKEISKSKEK